MTSRIKALSLNERRLVELLFREERARIDLAEAINLTGATVTRLVQALLDMELLQQATAKLGARGQPKKILSLNKTHFYSIGIYLYGEKIKGIVINLEGDILKISIEKKYDHSVVKIAETINTLVEDLILKSGIQCDRLLGVGITIPGNFESLGDIIHAHEKFIELDGITLHKEVSKTLGWPVWFENDGTASALGEYLFRHETNKGPLFLIHIGYGLGGGVIIDGSPFRGYQGNSCLSGTLFPYGKPRPTLQDLEITIENAGLSKEILWENNDKNISEIPVITQWIERATDQLAFVVRVVSGMYDPEVIIIGGSLPSSITEALVAKLQIKPIEGPSRNLKVAPVIAATRGEHNGVIGAASLPLYNQLFSGQSIDQGNTYLNGRVKTENSR